MGTTNEGRVYSDPILFQPGCVAPNIVTESPTLAAFNTEGRQELIAELRAHAFYVTALTGANNDFQLIARTPGVGGLDITIAIVVSGNNTALSVVVTDSAIVVNSATNGSGTATSTAAQVVAAINANDAARALVIPALAPSNDGTGAVVALAATNLIDWPGTSPTLDGKLQQSVDDTVFADVAAAFTQKIAVGASQKLLFAPVGTKAKWVVALGGTSTPKAAYSIVAWARP
jgi:hypothetical protein